MTAARTRQRGQVRMAAIVAIATMIVWLALSWLGGAIGLEARFAFLLDFAAMAAFVFVIAVALRARRKERGQEQSDA